jgi:hypothetical protein
VTDSGVGSTEPQKSGGRGSAGAGAGSIVRQIADAVLYEGHMLFPYRPSALKNQQRWTFGGVYPPTYAATTGDRSRVSFQCLVEGSDPQLDVEVRFLQILEREPCDEAVERTVGVGTIDLPPLEGRVESCTDEVRPGLHRLAVAIESTSPWSGTSRDEAMRHTFASAHAVARVRDGAFVSALEADEPLHNEGLWPVLVGEEGDRSTMLASPIILSDYPRVAPESPGDFFDGCEIDQLLVLSILGLSDDEKREIRAGDARARAILERTEAMSEEELMRLHGTWRR